MEGEFKRYIVLRKCPPEMAIHEGRWLSLDGKPQSAKVTYMRGSKCEVSFSPTGRYETRDDGVKAEVYEPCEMAGPGG